MPVRKINMKIYNYIILRYCPGIKITNKGPNYIFIAFQKPKTKKKKFIDPKRERTATFAVIHRSQRDPLAADDEAPQRLLQPIKETIPDSYEKKQDTKKKLKDLKEEERKFGVFYDDEYDYLQHLKDREAPEYDWSEMDKFLIDASKDQHISGHNSSNNTDLGQPRKSKQVFLFRKFVERCS